MAGTSSGGVCNPVEVGITTVSAGREVAGEEGEEGGEVSVG